MKFHHFLISSLQFLCTDTQRATHQVKSYIAKTIPALLAAYLVHRPNGQMARTSNSMSLT